MTLVQNTHYSSGGTSATSHHVTFPSNNTAGNFLVMAYRNAGSSGQNFTLSDTQGNTWVQYTHGKIGSADQYSLWYCENCAGGANTLTVVATNGLAFFFRMVIAEFSGVNTSGSINGSAGTTGSGSAPNSGSTSFSSSNLLLLGFAGNSTADSESPAGTGGFTIVDNADGNLFLCYKTVSASGSYAFSGSYAGSVNWGAGISGHTIPAPPPATAQSVVCIMQ